jgi:hypothetical protein
LPHLPEFPLPVDFDKCASPSAAKDYAVCIDNSAFALDEFFAAFLPGFVGSEW